MSFRATLILLVAGLVFAPISALAAPMVTFYGADDISNDGITHTATIPAAAHTDAMVIVATTSEGGDWTPTSVVFDGDDLVGQVGGNEESGNAFLTWGPVGNVAAGDVTLTFSAADTLIAVGVWVLEDFVESPSASTYAAWDDSGLSNGGPEGKFALNPDGDNIGTLRAATSDVLAMNAGDYVFAALYNGNGTENYAGLLGALTNDRGIEEGQGSMGVQYADGIATLANQEAGFNATEEWYRVAIPAVAFTPVPEPATMSLLALGGLAVLRRRKRA
jgi:hypothetical protein